MDAKVRSSEFMSAKEQVWDDPSKDFRQRYALPEQFIWDEAEFARIDFDGYVQAALSLLPQPPTRVVDVGCGPGLGSQILTERGYEVTGIDYSERAIGFARVLVPAAQMLHHDIRHLSDLTRLHGQFHAAYCIEVIEHVPLQFQHMVLSGIYDLLRESGILVISVPSPRMPLNRWHYKHFTIGEIGELLNSSGFKVETTVFQHRMTILSSSLLWRLMKNKYYDLRFVRRAVRRLFLEAYNTTQEADHAGRFILRAVKSKGSSSY